MFQYQYFLLFVLHAMLEGAGMWVGLLHEKSILQHSFIKAIKSRFSLVVSTSTPLLFYPAVYLAAAGQ